MVDSTVIQMLFEDILSKNWHNIDVIIASKSLSNLKKYGSSIGNEVDEVLIFCMTSLIEGTKENRNGMFYLADLLSVYEKSSGKTS